ncbi:radical SAM protein [Citrifermentans bremense]|uniref:radical SAM protein n=1 Tax=Citrifermentans bremense TaxID=60035 RepID=UPI0004149C49|nr:radical SAM protein [Citrifermentans bremense]
MEMHPPITPKPDHNYVAFFLSFACNLSCSYCINLHDRGSRAKQAGRRQMSAADWVAAADRLVLRPDLPLTLQGGEPTLYPGFYRFVNEVKPELKMDLMTNMMFDVDRFIREVPIWRFTREAPYAAIRVSYHPGQNQIEDLIGKTLKLQEAGFRIGLYGIEHPDPGIQGHIKEVQAKCLALGLDFRTKEFLGEHQGEMHGTFRYDGCVSGSEMKECECRTTEVIVDPTGYVYRCHSDLYRGREPIAHILDDAFNEEWLDEFRPCAWYGDCNPCDVKVKTNRFQIFGHTSVEIRNINGKN